VARNDFVNYDDSDYVTANRHVQGGFTWENVRWAFTSGHASNWHPLTWYSHMADWQLFGEHPWGHHLVNVVFHIVNTVLVFLVFMQMTGAFWRCAIVASLFGLHPLHVESVAWVSERKDVLSGLFFLLTLWAYTKYVGKTTVPGPGENPKSEIRKRPARLAKDTGGAAGSPISAVGGAENGPAFNRQRLWYYVLALVLFVLGLMSKPMLVTMPFILLLLDFWPFKRLELGFQKAAFKTLLLRVGEKVPFFALSVASCMVTFDAQRKGGAVSTILTLGARFANAAVSYARYLGKTFWPLNLSVLYPHPGNWPALAVTGASLLLAAIFVVVFLQGRQRPYLVMGWLWFFGMLVPVIGLVQVGIQSMADRYAYLPLIGVFIMLVWGLDELVPKWAGRDNVLATCAAVALLFCAALTVRQVGFWHDSQALFERAVEVTPRNYLAYNNIGYYLSGKGKSAEAVKHYQKSLEINPQYEDALNNIGFALAGQKRYDEALRYYQAALRVRPDNVEVHNNLGNALSEMGRGNEAIEHYLFVLSRKPDHADAHNNLGIALAMQGKLDDAIEHFHAAIQFKPKYANAHSNLGNALAAQHKLDEAIKEYEESLRLSPHDAQAHNNLGNALAEQGRVAEAVPQYQEALRLNADNPEAHFNLGLALMRLGKREEAAAHLREAVRLKPDYEEAKKQLNGLETNGASGPGQGH
jgi:tetratricopeptide (TPR) repeat protein